MICPLCSAKSHVITTTPHWTLLLNENQATLGRVYFVLNRHETDIARLSSEEQADLWHGLAEAKAALVALFSPDHVNFVFHMNLVPHVHAHLYPRYRDSRHFGGETFLDSRYGGHYDPSEERILSSETMDELVTAIRGALRTNSGTGSKQAAGALL